MKYEATNEVILRGDITGYYSEFVVDLEVPRSTSVCDSWDQGSTRQWRGTTSKWSYSVPWRRSPWSIGHRPFARPAPWIAGLNQWASLNGLNVWNKELELWKWCGVESNMGHGFAGAFVNTIHIHTSNIIYYYNIQYFMMICIQCVHAKNL